MKKLAPLIAIAIALTLTGCNIFPSIGFHRGYLWLGIPIVSQDPPTPEVLAAFDAGRLAIIDEPTVDPLPPACSNPAQGVHEPSPAGATALIVKPSIPPYHGEERH